MGTQLVVLIDEIVVFRVTFLLPVPARMSVIATTSCASRSASGGRLLMLVLRRGRHSDSLEDEMNARTKVVIEFKWIEIKA